MVAKLPLNFDEFEAGYDCYTARDVTVPNIGDGFIFRSYKILK